MATARLELPNGTSVILEGTPEEVHRLLSLYGGQEGIPSRKRGSRKKGKPNAPTSAGTSLKVRAPGPDLSQIINLVKTSEDAEAIETRILDRASVVNRVLLPLYIVHEYLENEFGLTSGDVSKVTTDLGIPVQTANASTTLSKTAARYVIGDKVRKKGVPVRYRLSRRGVQYMKSVVAGGSDEG